MESNKNYPWLGNLKISNQAIQKWKEERSTKSLTFWALRNKSINQKAYFDWAVERYQMPFLKGIFFEQNLMTKTQWNEIKDFFDWTEEILPVAFWNDTIFVGCVEPPKKEVKFLDFEIRYVLTSYQSLRIMWKFVQSLSHLIEKEVTKSIAINELNKKLGSLNLDEPLKPLDKSVNIKPVLTPKKNVNLDILSQKKPEQPALVSQQAVEQDLPPSKKPLDKPVHLEPMMNLEEQAGFPEGEEEQRVVEDDSAFPGRAPVEDNVLVMEDFKKQDKPTVDKKSAHFSDNKKFDENTKFTTLNTMDKTFTHFSGLYNYEDLWKYTKSFYCTSLVLKVKGNKIYPTSWTGRIQCVKTTDIFVDLDDYSLFKVVKRGYSYNGFVVDNSVNKKFFSQIGWQEYPKHVTAIPIKDNENKLVNIFVGLGLEVISRKETQQIEENVLKFFHSVHKMSQAA